MFTDILTDTPLSSPTPDVDFSYAHSGQSLFRKTLIRPVEALTGQPHLRRLYLDWVNFDRWAGEPVFAAALSGMGVLLAGGTLRDRMLGLVLTPLPDAMAAAGTEAPTTRGGPGRARV